VQNKFFGGLAPSRTKPGLFVTEAKLSVSAISLTAAQAATTSDGKRFLRVQGNFLARVERSALNELCLRVPDCVTPDHLTALGFAGAIVTATGYVASACRPEFLFVSCVGLVLNWFGDSLDGSLARHRGIERPVYGYFIDHSVDALSMVVVLFGLGVSPYVNMTAALLALVGYMLIGIHVFVKNHVTGVMQLSFFYFGPTEARIGLILGTCAAYLVGERTVTIMDSKIEAFSLIAASLGVIFLIVFVVDTIKTARFLSEREARLRN
jgi:archaetidylinositol phosphate synthase